MSPEFPDALIQKGVHGPVSLMLAEKGDAIQVLEYSISLTDLANLIEKLHEIGDNLIEQLTTIVKPLSQGKQEAFLVEPPS